jgi:hypothetical protein
VSVAVPDLVLVRSMWRRWVIAAALTISFSSCMSLRVDGTWVYGTSVRSISAADVRAAIAADRAADHRPLPVYKIDVVSSSEMHIYHDREDIVYCIVKRVNQNWRFTDRLIIVSG